MYYVLADQCAIRWPSAWNNPSALDLLKGGAITHLLIERGSDLGSLAARAQQQGLSVAAPGDAIAGVTVVEGAWPGVKLSQSGSADRADAGPTGVPWVDSNGWKIRLTSAQNPGTAVWVNAASKETPPRDSYPIAVADSAVYGGRWIISLDDDLISRIAARNPEGLEVWQRITAAGAFFNGRKSWSDYVPQAVVGIISDFTGQNEFMGQEVLNLVARTNQQYRILLKGKGPEFSFSGLRAVLYADAEPPSAELRKRVLSFVQAGGMLITGPHWGEPAGTPAKGEDHPRYALRALGKGRVAVAKAEFDDPYMVAYDSAVLISHRHELLRFWNPGALGSYLTATPDQRRAVAQMLFFATAREGEPSVRVAGRYRAARLWTLDQPAARNLEMEIQKDAVELHLPPVSVYAAVELEA